MIGLGPLRRVRSVVAIGAHPDDIEIGAGGLLLMLAQSLSSARVGVPTTDQASGQATAQAASGQTAAGQASAAGAVGGLHVYYVVLSGTPQRHTEARSAAAAFLPGAQITFALHTLRDGRLPGSWATVKKHLHAAADETSEGTPGAPDLVLVPSVDDAHQDHRLLGELAPTVFRDQLVLHYEIPKWDGDLGRPSVYCALPDAVARRKVELLNTCFAGQKAHDWWDDEVFLGLMRLRGMECRSRYAEAFSCRKLLLHPGPAWSRSA